MASAAGTPPMSCGRYAAGSTSSSAEPACDVVADTQTICESATPSIFFRVEAYEPSSLLRLRAEMKVPGGAWLEWRVSAEDDGRTRLRQLARFTPRGVAGRLYWWVLLPIHKVIWKQLAERLVACAEQPGS